jgi:hypothetical protein
MFKPEAAQGDGVAVEGADEMTAAVAVGKWKSPAVRDFQAEWETCFWISTQRLFHRLLVAAFLPLECIGHVGPLLRSDP